MSKESLLSACQEFAGGIMTVNGRDYSCSQVIRFLQGGGTEEQFYSGALDKVAEYGMAAYRAETHFALMRNSK